LKRETKPNIAILKEDVLNSNSKLNVTNNQVVRKKKYTNLETQAWPNPDNNNNKNLAGADGGPPYQVCAR
jgi:hypothetical protein